MELIILDFYKRIDQLNEPY